jgi:hypothetical protein
MAIASLTACGEEASKAQERGAGAVQFCGGHGGVTAIEDDITICRDQVASEERGSNAVRLCANHGGVSAFDDDVVICRDQSVRRAEE